ncbi:UDP-2,3-diacylglucosamine diphosphatase [Leptothrix discophora]|uniref:UDP-2,3-diacylglucosamine hydrolase n=1 Tax=Leptothrix discophora TaxID=89 RepID=A0ABT9G548_LEPDI|nr:UDP-2,3-diacylglucosamine diphosphatase [Leptothrix discophora]MDP4301611.1 UDP-2,3-diacylglucosamine diphosphatase [Leptothrix discophora]
MASDRPADAATPASAWVLPAHWRAVEFIADLHLAEDTPATLAALAAHLRGTDADAVLLLGDIFEVWIGDDSLDESDSFEARAFATLTAAVQARHRPLGLALLVGNRDFLLGPQACRAAGLQAMADPTVLVAPWGERLLVGHGDAWCLDDTAYQAFRAQVRSTDWQDAFLARPLSERRAIARQLREASEARKRDQGVESYGDLDADAVRAALVQAGARTLVHGHTHRPACHDLGDGLSRWVLSDWHDHPVERSLMRADLLRWCADGLQRRTLPGVQPA